MGIAREFDNIIKRHLNVNAAWYPITTPFSLGDYGIISDGTFVKIGNIQEFGVHFMVEDGSDASIDFTSVNATVLKFAGGAQVDTIPAGAIDAKIKYKFGNEKSFIVKAPLIKVSQIQNLNQVAISLKETKNWSRKWKVVYQVYHAQNPLIVSTKSPGTEITLSGNVDVLRNLKGGDASLELSSSSDLGLNIQGKEGIICLGLFKLKGNGPGILGYEKKKVGEEFEILDSSFVEEEDL